MVPTAASPPVDGPKPEPAPPLEAGTESLRGLAARFAAAPRVEPADLVVTCAPSWASGVDLVVERANFCLLPPSTFPCADVADERIAVFVGHPDIADQAKRIERLTNRHAEVDG